MLSISTIIPIFLLLTEINIMFKHITTTLVASMILVTLSACGNKTETAPSKASDAISIINPHIREMPPGQKVTAMYFELKNSSSNPHDLITVMSKADISNVIELHTHTNDNGVMKMSEVESIPVAANSSTIAKPGSYHVMIMGLKKELKLGEKYDFNLIFKDGSSTEITAEVKKINVQKHH